MPSGHIFTVADGDSFSYWYGVQSIHGRLFGADAPELHQRFGKQARDRLAELIFDKTLSWTSSRLDCYGRTVLDLWLTPGERVAWQMIHDGLAWHTPRWSPDRQHFAQAQRQAKQARKGLWHDDEPIPPWTWRRAHREFPSPFPRTRRRRIRRP